MAIVAGSVNGLLCKRPARVTTWKNDADACYVVNDVTTGLRWRKGKSRRKEGGGGGGGGRNSVIGPPSICFLLSIFTHRSGHSSLLLTFFLGRWRFSPFPPARPWMYLLMFINIDVCHIPSCGQSINHAPITFISNDQRCRPVNNHQL